MGRALLLSLPEDSSPANTRPTTSNSPLARIATKSSAAPSLKSLIEEAVSEVSLQLVYFGSGNFIPDPEKKFFHQDGCIEALHCQKTISSNTNAISILSFYLIFLLSYQKSSPKEKTKKLSKMFSWTEQNH